MIAEAGTFQSYSNLPPYIYYYQGTRNTFQRLETKSGSDPLHPAVDSFLN